MWSQEVSSLPKMEREKTEKIETCSSELIPASADIIRIKQTKQTGPNKPTITVHPASDLTETYMRPSPSIPVRCVSGTSNPSSHPVIPSRSLPMIAKPSLTRGEDSPGTLHDLWRELEQRAGASTRSVSLVDAAAEAILPGLAVAAVAVAAAH